MDPVAGEEKADWDGGIRPVAMIFDAGVGYKIFNSFKFKTVV